MSLGFISTSVGLVLDGWLFRDIHFRRPLELEVNDSQKPTAMQTLNNPVNFFS